MTIFHPFKFETWALFLLSLFVVTFAFYRIIKVNFVFTQNSKNDYKYVNIFGYVYATFLEQGQALTLTSHSTRLLVTFWLLFAMVTATAYRGKLVSLMAFPVAEWIPTTYTELAKSNYKVALNVVGRGGAAYDSIASSSSTEFKEISRRMELIPDAEECIRRAIHEEFACILSQGQSDFIANKALSDKHGRVPIRESLDIALFIVDGLVYEKRAIFGERLSNMIATNVQMGLGIKWYRFDLEFVKEERRQYEQSNHIAKPVYDFDGHGPKKLVLSQFAGVLLLSTSGLVFSCGQFVRELIFRHNRKLIKP